MMLDKGALLVFFCLTMQTVCSPLYPALRFGQKASSSSFILRSSADDGHVFPDTDGPLQLSVPLRDPPEERTARHADAIFTNSYRKVLGQISARKFLQTIMGKRLGDESAEESSQVSKRQARLYRQRQLVPAAEGSVAIPHQRAKAGAEAEKNNYKAAGLKRPPLPCCCDCFQPTNPSFLKYMFYYVLKIRF
ncbi:somatoliberin [Acipenser oxyrinchus oxyrinchus]|uniref:Somatoliberin n=1 Tax=Acipenser oxyrinchus oxyrinchus TaxID=40147 RepID=A0AAD8CTS3_ACIOX|nr:somatoliberin [Acipenser oxyrinchus oxyrinchus]